MRGLLWLVLIALLAAPAAFYFWPRPEQTAPQTVAAPSGEAEPAIRYPIENAGRVTEPLPRSAAEHEARQALLELFGSRIRRVLVPEDIIRRMVATVDGLPRDQLPARILPVKPPGGFLLTRNTPEGVVLAGQNAGRYRGYVSLLDVVPTDKMVAVYISFYPVLQEQYEALGYPGRYFNDRVVAVVDHLLATPEVRGPLLLGQARVLYEFADPDLESLSAGQKLLLRIGGENRKKVKSKLVEIRRALTAEASAGDLPMP